MIMTATICCRFRQQNLMLKSHMNKTEWTLQIEGVVETLIAIIVVMSSLKHRRWKMKKALKMHKENNLTQYDYENMTETICCWFRQQNLTL